MEDSTDPKVKNYHTMLIIMLPLEALHYKPAAKLVQVLAPEALLLPQLCCQPQQQPACPARPLQACVHQATTSTEHVRGLTARVVPAPQLATCEYTRARGRRGMLRFGSLSALQLGKL
jgi:hypothetical protein